MFLIVIPIMSPPTAAGRRRASAPRAVVAALLCAPLAGVAACGSDEAADAGPTVVVTTPMLGTVVEELVGGAAEVDVVMPNGIDPHDFQPSAKDVEAISKADLVVENGLDLEEGLEDALGTARDDGVRVFTATDHATLREASVGEEEHAEGEEEHGHSGDDPHIWMDPVAMRDVALALAPVLEDDLGLEVSGRAADLREDLDALNAEVREIVSSVPAGRRKLVTGHESMGYFADRYGFELVGAVIPSLSSQAQASAAALAELRDQVRDAGVPAIFNEIGTPEGVAEAIADETGARVVEVATHTLPDDGSYETFMREAAAAVAGGLSGPPAS
jgi:zinc/manganese transport system substrate-binding protein